MHDLPIPKTLLEMQTWFANIITSSLPERDDADLPIYPLNLIDEIRKEIAPSPQLKSEERMGIYHQQYWWRLLTIMQEIYPSLVRLFDYGDFNHQIAEPYLLKCPPNDWFLSNLGSQLPEWLKKNYREKDAPLVLALARLDLAYENMMFTECLPKIESDALNECESKPMYLQPFVMLFKFDVDLFTFRMKLLEHPPTHWLANDFPELEKSRKKRHFILFRKNEKDFHEETSLSHFALLSRFQKGAKLIDLVPLLTKCDDIVEWFKSIAARGWLTLTNPKPSIQKKQRISKNMKS